MIYEIRLYLKSDIFPAGVRLRSQQTLLDPGYYFSGHLIESAVFFRSYDNIVDVLEPTSRFQIRIAMK